MLPMFLLELDLQSETKEINQSIYESRLGVKLKQQTYRDILKREISSHDLKEILTKDTQIKVLHNLQEQLEDLEQTSWISFTVHGSHEAVDKDRSQTL